MAWLLARKLLLLLLLIPLLHVAGFWYASTFGATTIAQQFDPQAAPTQSTDGFWDGYRAYAGQMLQGDLGSFQRVPLTRLLVAPVRNTFVLLGVSVAVTLVLAPAISLLAVSPQTGRMRPWAQAVLAVGSSLPGFFLGSVLIVLLLYISRSGLYRGSGTLIPIQGFGLDDHLVLPVLTIVARPVMYVAYLGAGLLEAELQQDYIRVAQSKGLSWRALLWRHALPNVAAPLVGALGQSLRLIIGGLILAEALFDWRGIGRILMNIFAIDRGGGAGSYYMNAPLLALFLALFGALLLLADLVAGLIAYRTDPRLRRVA